MNARKLSKLIRLQRGPFRKSRITRCMGCELLAGDRHSVSDGKPRCYISVKGSEGGTVSGGGYYRPKDFIAIVATPDRGYRFEVWRSSAGFVSHNRRTTLYVQNNEEWLAMFEPLPLYTVVTESTDHRVDDILQGAGTYYKGETAHFWAPWTFEHPSWGHQVFNNWSRYHEGDPYSAWQMVSSRPEFEQVIEDNWIYKAQYVGM